jgi:hypothetical protein
MRKSDSEESRLWEEHPLFPLEEGGKPFEVAFISLFRKEGGAMVLIPQIYPANELTKADQISERYGGGIYELWARGASITHVGQPGNITKKRLLTIPGKPKLIDPTNATVMEEIAAGIRPNPADVTKPQGLGALGGGDGGVLVAILQMGQQAAQAQAQQSQQFMALMMQMMSEGKKESAESMRMMMQMMTTMTQSQQQSMMQILPLLVTSKGGGPDELDKYLALFQKLGMKTGLEPPKDPDADDGVSVSEVLSNVATIVQGAPAALSALKEMAPGNGQAALPLGAHVGGPVGEPIAGSAASVLSRG